MLGHNQATTLCTDKGCMSVRKISRSANDLVEVDVHVPALQLVGNGATATLEQVALPCRVIHPRQHHVEDGEIVRGAALQVAEQRTGLAIARRQSDQPALNCWSAVIRRLQVLS